MDRLPRNPRLTETCPKKRRLPSAELFLRHVGVATDSNEAELSSAMLNYHSTMQTLGSTTAPAYRYRRYGVQLVPCAPTISLHMERPIESGRQGWERAAIPFSYAFRTSEPPGCARFRVRALHGPWPGVAGCRSLVPAALHRQHLLRRAG